MKHILLLIIMLTLGISSCNRECGVFSVNGTFYSKIDFTPIANKPFIISYTYRKKVNGKLYQNSSEFSTNQFGKWSHTGVTQCVTNYEIKTKSGEILYSGNKVGDLGNLYITP